MITYLYWFAVIAVCIALVYGFAVVAKNWKAGAVVAMVVLVVAWGTYYFRLQQVFVKHYGGVMTISVPNGQLHMGATWKEDNMWIENYDPATNSCYFTEYSKGNLLQGKVTIKNCNPMMPQK